MSLSCDCSDDYDFYYEPPNDYKTIDKDKKCCSCKQEIKAGELLLEFNYFEIDEDLEEEYRRSDFMCEKCGDIYLSLEELGFCINLGYSMEALLNEYHHDYLGITE